jgi:PPOX class probable F420-dependent enzyme
MMKALPNDVAFPALEDADYMLLITYRRNGTPVETPVPFAQVDGRVYVATRRDAGKVTRVEATGRATVAPCTTGGRVLGPKLAAQGRVLAAEDATQAEAALRAKYALRSLGAGAGQRVYLELRPYGVHADVDIAA